MKKKLLRLFLSLKTHTKNSEGASIRKEVLMKKVSTLSQMKIPLSRVSYEKKRESHSKMTKFKTHTIKCQ